MACELPWIDSIQFPFNIEFNELRILFNYANLYKTKVILNRPLGMGALAQHTNRFEISKKDQLTQAFEFIANELSEGVVLTGTTSREHLEENLLAFNSAKRNCMR